MANSATSTNSPVKVLRLRGISASIFENTSKSADNETVFHKVSIQRTYKDGDEFKTTTIFGRDDLPVVQLLTLQAWEFILTQESASAKKNS
jgi:hypothetical protein